MSVRIMSFKAGRLLWILAAAAAVILVMVLLFMKPSGDSHENANVYVPGAYSTSVTLGDQEIQLYLTCSESEILELTYDVPESLSEIYPLVEQCCASYSEQLQSGTPVSALTVESAYSETADYIMSAILRLMDMCHL